MAGKGRLLEKVFELIRQRLPEDQAAQAEEFARRFYAWIPLEDLSGRSPVDLYGAAVSHWSFAGHRTPGSSKIRVYNPQFEEHGWQSTHTAVEIVSDDMPFLVDSVRLEINRQGRSIHLMVHPIMNIRRDDSGELLDILPPDSASEDAIAESVLHVEVDRTLDPAALEELRSGIESVFEDVRAAVEDWPTMREKTRHIAAGLEGGAGPVDPEVVSETRAFLEWIDDNNFTFLGYREYELGSEGGEDVLRTVSDSGLGILRDSGRKAVSRSFAKLPPDVRRLAREPRLLNLTKANSRATVHRSSYLDYIGVKQFDENGEARGEQRFLGLYTFSAYSASVFDIPLVRRKANYVLERAGFPKASHNEKDLVEILETYPRDELFQTSKEDLFDIAMGILHLQERQRVRLFVRRDDFGRFLSCLVFVPRERYNTSVREKMQEILLDAFDARNVEFNVRLSESVLARLHFVIYTEPGKAPDYDAGEIEEQLVEASRSWTDNLHTALIERFGEARGVDLHQRYRDAFPPGYQNGFLARTAASDIARIEELSPHDDLGMSLYHPLEETEDFLGFKLFKLGGEIILSRVMPLLENMGVDVVDERPHKIQPRNSPPVWIYDFGLLYAGNGELQTGQVKDIFQDAFARAWRGEVEDDGFNRLILKARLTWREISVLRAYSKYLRQIGTTFSQDYMEDTLTANPHIARLLVELFEARFDPDRQGGVQETERLTGEIETALDGVTSLDEDRIMRSFLNVTLATMRTNHFQTDENGRPKPYLSFKLDPRGVPDLPLPRPRFEIFVYSPHMEGVHLRGGEVARGGIRWSDRREDFRTEILGLMKAQTVKNAVIVPVGAKGGFIVKHPPADGGREAFMQEGIACYMTLIRGMLDLTDNLSEDGTVTPPPRVARYDDDDPYLVAAADKGTATFSDIANGISEEYGFWLGDAFASGGATGYDHKKMGITARGAWESVKRHFTELDTDVQNEDFTVVGIGDMSGDVFGNGMLLSRHIRLLGAFDHRHIFLDPDPEPETSFEERERLFEMPRSSWADYDGNLISEGGGVFPRTAKSVELSPQMQEMLGVDAERMTPSELMSALLRAEVDLLWNGGIGTYVKSSAETNADAGDKANDALRVDAKDLSCRVVGEGGNLGFTQRGRVEYALNGGRIYMDAIDNSAGVDCSDHEVNIKILLNAIVESGDMTEKQRNELLAAMTEEVGELVLRDNYQQTQAINQALTLAHPMVDVHIRYVRELEQHGGLDRDLEYLPSDETLGERRSNGLGLTAPELAVLLSYSKVTLYRELLDSDLPEDPYISREMERYFPEPLQERFGDRMRGHRLRRQISATHVTNSMINRCGPSFAYRMREETGASAADIARAYTVTREIFDLRGFWEGVQALDNQIDAGVQTSMMLEGRKLAERGTRWVLRNRRSPLDIAAVIECFSDGAAEVEKLIPDLLLDGDREVLEGEISELIEAEVPDDLARRSAILGAMFSALDIVDIAGATGQFLEAVASVYFTLGDHLNLHWLRRRIEKLPRDNRWRTLARSALREDLYAQQAALTSEVLRATPEDSSARERIETWISANQEPVGRAQQVLTDINSSGTFDLSTLPVALREIRNLINVSSDSTAEVEASTR